MQIGLGTYALGGLASYFGLGMPLQEKFQKIREMGYDSVELLPSDLTNDMQDIIRWRDEAGLTITSIHAEPTEPIVQAMAALGGQAVIWAGTPFCNKAEAIEVAKQLDEMAEMAAPYGIKIAYHNHFQELYYTEGKTLLEHLADNSSKCYFQLDCGWAMYGGMYPANFIRSHKDRILAIHVKENTKVYGAQQMPPSRHAQQDNAFAGFENIMELPVEEREKMMDMILNSGMLDQEGFDFTVQCPMGAPESNINWQEIKDALDEQSFDAFWVVEREGFYGDETQCLIDDVKWLRENVHDRVIPEVKVTSIGHVAMNVRDFEKSVEFYGKCLGLPVKFQILNGEFADSIEASIGDQMEGAGEEMIGFVQEYLKKFREDEEAIMLAYIEIAPGQLLELFPVKEAEDNDRTWPLPQKYGYNHISLMVDDIQALKERLTAFHVPIIQDVSMGMEHTYQMWAMDPDGMAIEFMQYTPDSWQLIGR